MAEEASEVGEKEVFGTLPFQNPVVQGKETRLADGTGPHGSYQSCYKELSRNE